MLNTFLKTSETLTIIPALAQTRNGTSVHWYEIQVVPRERIGRVMACNKEGETVGVAEAMIVNDYTARFTIIEGGVIVFTSETSFRKIGSDEINLQTRIGETEVNLTGNLSDPLLVQRTDNAISPSQKLPDHWLSLHDPLVTLAEAMKVRATDGRSWGCSSCLVFLVGDSIAWGGCAASPNPGVCAAAITGWGVFTENCTGACA